MEKPETSNESPNPPAPKRNRSRRFLIVGMVILMAAGGLLLFSARDNSNLVWLTPEQMAHATRPGLFAGLTRKLKSWGGPLVNWYRSRRPYVNLKALVYARETNAADDWKLGIPVGTNETGMRAWILTPMVWGRLRTEFSATNALQPLFAPAILTADRTRSQIQMGSSIPVGKNYVPVGFMLDVVPKSSGTNFNLTVGAVWTDATAGSGGASMAIKTNLNVACLVAVPNRGALVIDCGDAKTSGTNHWLIIVPTAVDAQGKLLNW